MSSKISRRRRLLVDTKVQGALVLRITLYWLMCVATVGLMLFCWWATTGPVRAICPEFNNVWFYYVPGTMAALTVLGLVVHDMLRLSNRFVGPLVRLRRCMRALAQGEPVAPIHFREGDFWQEMADEFNAVAERMQRQEPLANPSQWEQFSEEVEPQPVP